MTHDDEPSDEYLKGYNHGYKMSEHEPALLDKILKSTSGMSDSEYLRAMAKGKAQFEKERAFNELKRNRDRTGPEKERE